ncbi:hypothetical protein BU24DRAFT_448894 [Aaosphaeria arxii CBS 175.79]|uniref:Carbohydrate-binding module family 48 protein n=1 Tax=Aaosphaeria arxii CBS 175.79 TaxID=1450172 RepID=A0A6A5XW41_9PLEO|nr:uncharacterized protein BU24DRAFT_448894 [Aaosphaeria arxii CBS 175.79]KAF2017156.1 hypothetical protein BU24DRAFT_448894 [Aaosphaeria arxii CBS 175.79]
MSADRHRIACRPTTQSLLWSLCLWTSWAQGTAAVAQGGLIPSAPPIESRPQGLIPSQPPGIIPSQPPPEVIPSQPPPGIIPSQSPPGLIPSQSPPGIIPSQPPPEIIPSQRPPGIIPSQPVPQITSSPPQPSLIPSAPIPSDPIPSQPVPTFLSSGSLPGLIPTAAPSPSGTHVVTTTSASMVSTDNWVRPIPPAETTPGNPNGHHEVSAPNFSKTASCKGCSPLIEVPATGWFDWPSTPIPEHAGSSTTPSPNKATVIAGTSAVIVDQDPSSSGNFIIGGSTTVRAGQTVIVDNTPIAVHTSSGHTAIVVGDSTTLPFVPSPPQVPQSQITEAPLLLPVTVGDKTITANPQSEYIIEGQTLQPGGAPITVDGSTVSLAPSATAIVINGVTSTIAQVYGAVYTTIEYPFLTLNNQVFTANRAGYYVLAPGTTLIPGGSPVTVSGTVVSLEPYGTVAVIQGSQSTLAPVTTIVTLTRGGGFGGGGNGVGATSDGGVPLPFPTGSAANVIRVPTTIDAHGWPEGIFVMFVIALGWLTVWL